MCFRKKSMLFCSTVDLSIFRALPGSMEPNSLISTLNWSRRFFSDLFLDTLKSKKKTFYNNYETFLYTAYYFQVPNANSPLRISAVITVTKTPTPYSQTPCLKNGFLLKEQCSKAVGIKHPFTKHKQLNHNYKYTIYLKNNSRRNAVE